MRKGFEGLYGMVRDRLQCDPLSGHVFLFANARRNRMKLVFWDGSGLWVCSKRLEKGCFRWPESSDSAGKVVLSHEQFGLLLGGIDLGQTRPRRWYRKPVVNTCAISAKIRQSWDSFASAKVERETLPRNPMRYSLICRARRQDSISRRLS